MADMVGPYTLIEDNDTAQRCLQALKQKTLLAIDFESEWNLHCYGMHLCLIQICDDSSSYLVDPQKVTDLTPFVALMEDPHIQKICHSPRSDFLLLDYVLDCHPKNIFDTEKAALLLGRQPNQVSLASLLQSMLHVSKDVAMQTADWTRRPLSPEMLCYAIQDVEYLIPLKNLLEAELRAKKRWEWLVEECALLENLKFKHKTHPYMKISGAQKLSEGQLSVLAELYQLREELALSLKLPPFHLIDNQRLLCLARHPPQTAEDWAMLPSVHPQIKVYSRRFNEAVLSGQSQPVSSRGWSGNHEKKASEFYNLQQKEESKQLLLQIKQKLDETYDVASLILSMKNVKQICYDQSLKVLRNWQKKIILETARELGLEAKLSALMNSSGLPKARNPKA